MKLKDILQEGSIDISNLESALDTQILISIADREDKILYTNENFLKTLDYSKEEIIGKTHRIFKSGTHSDQFYRKLWETIMDGQIWTGAILNKSKNGTLIWFKTKIIPIINDKTITHFIAISSDITENVKTTEMLQVAQSAMKNQNLDLTDELEKNKIFMKRQRFSVIGELASRVAHDVRNPLNVIRASLENIKLVYGTIGNTEKNFERIDNAIDRITHQIDDVLDFVKNRETKKESANLNDIISESVTLLNIPEKITIKKNLEDMTIHCDYIMIGTAVKNIIHNAIHACGDQGVIEINAHVNDNNIFISIIDSGPGIFDENIQKIFEPLFTTKQKGTGLGLASVKNIIEQHGGTISAKNNPTTFTIRLPKRDID